MNNNIPNYDLSNMDEALIRSQLWDARMALLDSRYHHQCTIDLWAEINRLFDALDALKAAQRPDTDYLTRDQMADMLGNDAYIHCNDYEDLEYISGSMKHPKPVGRFGIDPIY